MFTLFTICLHYVINNLFTFPQANSTSRKLNPFEHLMLNNYARVTYVLNMKTELRIKISIIKDEGQHIFCIVGDKVFNNKA